MSTKARLQGQLTRSRGFLEKILADFKTPQEWTHQVHPKANHALWVTGHLTTVDNFFTSLVAPEKAKDLPGYNEKFGMGSQPVADASAYPATDELLRNFRERRETLMGVLDGMTDEQLAEKMPPGSPDFFPKARQYPAGGTWRVLAIPGPKGRLKFASSSPKRASCWQHDVTLGNNQWFVS